jgi:hypothetical protein
MTGDDVEPLTQAEINRLEDAEYQAEHDMQDAADLIADVLDEIRRTDAPAFAAIVAIAAAAGCSGLDDVLAEYDVARAAKRTARNRLADAGVW